MTTPSVGILTVSDRCSKGEAEDTAGKNMEQSVAELLGWNVVERQCVPDEAEVISKVLMRWADELELRLILTVGGTGMAPRDVTPEATKAVLEREAPGIVHRMMAKSLEVTPLAMLSRLTAGTRNKSLIVNLPGSKKGSRECFEFAVPAIPHCVDLLCDRSSEVSSVHKLLQAGKQAHHVCPHQHNEESRVDSTDVAHRPRTSPYPIISVKEAQSTVLSFCKALPPEKVSLYQAHGRILAQDVFARDSLPPFPASIKDGYAVLSSDAKGRRRVLGDSTAGTDPFLAPLKPGTCLRINTGAPVPSGADAVVQVEDTKLIRSTEDGKEELEVEILVAPTPGQDIRPVGSDIPAGSKVLSKFQHVGAAEIGVLATVGHINDILVFRQPVVSLLSTGNELQDPSEELIPGGIRDSNKATLMALLKEHGFPVMDCGVAVDNPQHLLRELKLALDSGDIVVTTGGVSMGDRDYMRQVLAQDLKANIHFARVLMKPGKPTTFATLEWTNGKTRLVLGLPGNPVSATVTSHLYVLPACRKMAGAQTPFPAVVRAKCPENVDLDPRPEYRRAVVSWRPGEAVAEVVPTGNQISSRLTSFVQANGLIMMPARTKEKSEVKKGEEVEVMVIGQMWQQ